MRGNAWMWAALAWVGVIFFSSTSLASQWAEATYSFFSLEFLERWKPDSDSSGIMHLLADKGFHVTLFCVLAILLWITFQNMAHKSWVILGCGAVVGSASEFLQSFFPDRDPALGDVLINIGGASLGILICYAAGQLFAPASTLEKSSSSR
jgi:VanZ family protein